MRKPFTWAGCCLLTLAAVCSGTGARAETRRALLAGCNYYLGGLSRLYTSINDITGVRDHILCASDGYWPASNVTFLKDSQVRLARIRQEIAAAAQACQDGDIFVFMYSGHGMSYRGAEYICLYDLDYQDEELGADLAQFGSGVKIVIILDTCYSGGMFKAAGERGTGVGASTFAERALAAYQKAKAADPTVGSLVSKAALGANIGFMTASDKTELSWSYTTGYSFYTSYLIEAALVPESDANGDEARTFLELHDYAVPRVIADTVGDEVQTPQCYHPELLDGIVALGQPDLIRMDAGRVTVSEGDGAATVWLVREGRGTVNASVVVSTSCETAAPGTDYAEVKGQTVTWAAGDLAPKSVRVTLFDDAQEEGSETFWVACGKATGATVSGTESATRVTILDNDAAATGIIRFAGAAVNAGEDAGFAEVSVVRQQGSGGSASVGYRTRPVTASEGADYVPVEGVLSWVSGDSSARAIRIPILADALWEENERLEVELYGVSGASLGSPATAVVTLANVGTAKAPGKARFAATALSVSEAEGIARVMVLREGGSDGAVAASVKPIEGTAKAGLNYLATNAVVRWEHGDAAPKVYTFELVDDGVHRADPTFRLQLGDYKGGLSAGANGTTVSVALRDAKASVTLDEALDSAASVWTVSGAGFWYGQTLESEDGEDAAQLAGAGLSKGKEVLLQGTLRGPGVLSFSWRAQAQPEDAMQFLVGSAVKTQSVGRTGWERVEGLVIPSGLQRVKWRFAKNSFPTNAGDSAWLDRVVWQPDAAAASGPQPASGGTLTSAPPLVSWEPAAGAVSYAVYLGASSSVQTQLLGRTAKLALGLPGLVPGATYYWRVDAISEAGRITRGTVWRFTVPKGELAQVENPGGQTATVGVPFVLPLALRAGSPDASRFIVTGLPSGLSANAAGVISGRPTKTGAYRVSAAAVNGYGNGPGEMFTLTVEPLPPVWVGSFSGLTGLEYDAEGADHSLCGAAQLAVSAAGAVSASIRLMDGTYKVSGVFTNGVGGVLFEKTFAMKSGGVATLRLRPYEDPALEQRGYRGELFSAAGVGGVVLTRHAWAEDKPALAEYAGYYTAVLPPEPGGDAAAVPQGVGYLTMSVGASGAVTLAGVLADGTAWSGSATAVRAPDGNGLVVPVFATLYQSQGMLWGALRLAPNAVGVYDNEIGPYPGPFYFDAAAGGREGLVWFSARRETSRSYPDGFDSGLLVSGGAYHADTVSLEALIGKRDHLLRLRFDPVSDSVCDPSVTIALSGGAAWLPPAGTWNNPCKTTFAANAKTGLFSGTFTLSDTSAGKTVTRKVTYKGVLSPMKWTSGSVEYDSPGSGFFTVNELLPSPSTSRYVSLGAQLLLAPSE